MNRLFAVAIALAVPMAALVIWLLIDGLSSYSVYRAISRDAVDKSLHWGEYMSELVPDLEPLTRTGVPSEEQKAAIRQLRAVRDIFRFKLFDAEGRLVLVSDESAIVDPVGVASEPDGEARQVATSRQPLVELGNGTEKPDRPDLYAEAYIPLADDAGRTIGVVEVYVNVTNTEAFFKESFERFGLIVSAASALLFLLPAAGFALQRRLAQRSREEAEFLAHFDPLTGLLNRAEFLRRAEKLHADGQLSSLLFIDSDKFKQVNDTYGHAAGDEVLEQIGRILTANMDVKDLVARFGGDEFVVGFSGISEEMAVRRVRAILHCCAQPLIAGGASITGSVSVGVSFVDKEVSVSDALGQADAALYHAKAAGRNQYALYGDDMGNQLRRRSEMELLVQNAVENETFTIDYQKLVSGKSFRPIGYEALLRLKSNDGSPISPADFIPIAEDMGLIEKIGRWVIYTATKDIAAQDDYSIVAVNLSAMQFRAGDLPTIVADALSTSGLSADRLELEITESLLLGDDPSIIFQIDTLRKMGVGIAMDDFGTGFSSLGYLWRYGFDRIKIDRSFVSGLSDYPERSLQIIESVIMLGKRLGMNVTAEGVETEEQSALLSKLGCDVLQGFKFGRPAPLQAGAGREGEGLVADYLVARRA